MLISLVPLSYAQTYAIGPSLSVVTIPQDDPVLGTGVMILGLIPIGGALQRPTGPADLMSQYKLIVTYNGEPLTWQVGTPGPSVVCSVLEKDKVNVVADPKTGDGKQGAWENLMTALVDVSSNFVCEPRWKSPGTGYLESVGVLDVYYVGPGSTGSTSKVHPAYFIADNILVVESFFSAGRTTVFGSDIQDLCVLGWAIGAAIPVPVGVAAPATWIITKPDGTQHYIWSNPMGYFVSCGALALAQRAVLGIPLQTGQDPLWTATGPTPG
jgi:hypothetical protein